jgi:hypothetical protein
MTERTQRMEPDGAGRCKPSWLPDALIVLLILAAWVLALSWITGGKRVIWYDTFRDMAWAENMRAGRIWADPVVSGQTWWYAPGGPLLAAGISRLTGCSVPDVYGTSALWWNAWIPVAVYVLARVAWGRGTALLSLVTVFLGSYWWYTHTAAPIPGVQAVPLMLLALLCWHLSATRRRRYVWAAIGGVSLAACTWWHPVCGIVAALTILLHAVYDTLRRPRRAAPGVCVSCAGHSALRRMLVVGAVAAGLTWPLVAHMIAIHARNPYLLEIATPEIAQPGFYAHAYAPLVVPAALLGAWVILRHAPQTFWAVGCLLAALLLQLPAYLVYCKGLAIPYALPHEMQWHMQLAEGLCAAVAITWVARKLAQAAKRPRLVLPAAGLLAAVVAGPTLWQSARQGEYFIGLDQLLNRTRETRAWIVSHTSLEDTIACDPELGYAVVSGLTGRKCIAVSPGHMNPTPHVQERFAESRERLSAEDPTVAAAIARRYGAGYLFFTFASPESARAATEACDRCRELERCFSSDDGSAIIYRIRPETPP